MGKTNAPAPAPAAPPPPAADEHAGHGGSYVIENGVRRLVERTQTPADVGDQPEVN